MTFPRIIPFLLFAMLATSAVVAGETGAADPHAAHKKMMSAPTVNVASVDYAVPDIDLIDSSGSATNLTDLFAGDEPVVVNFIFTTCTTICPVITATTLQLQKKLSGESQQPHYISISIDPDYDSASVLSRYAADYGADWTFLTGSPDDINAALQAFDAYRGNKVNHFALMLMRPGGQERWTRVEGLTSAERLASIWREANL